MPAPPNLPSLGLPVLRRNRFSAGLLLMDAAVLAWLAWAFCQFTGRTPVHVIWFCGGSLAMSGVAWALLGHQPPSGYWRDWLARIFLCAGALWCGFLITFSTGLASTIAAGVWLAVVGAALLVALRIAWWAALARLPETKWELLRWLALGALAVWVLRPYYHDGGIGAGDAHWYAVMLADFVEQLRAGIFPVWTGQSAFAFNGAVVPLRVAPLFQHEGGLLDLLTGRALGPLALKNAVLALNGLAIVFAAYAAFRAVLPRRPDAAAALAGFFAASPAVLAPLYAGDQIMTFVALPFLPAVFYACWRGWVRDDLAARVWLVAGLAGLWLAHSPIGMWTTVCAGALWLARLAMRTDRSGAWRELAVMGGLFSLLASWPFLSILSLDNLNAVPTSGSSVAENVRAAFPANFQPVSADAKNISDYQPGFAVLALFAAGAVWWRGRRAPGAMGFAMLALALPALMLPVPGWLEWFWTHMPQTVVNITNTWPMQRLMVIWVAAMLFFVASVLAASCGEEHRHPGALRLFAWALALLSLAAWSASEAAKFSRAALTTRTTGAAAEQVLVLHNRLLTRYAYSSFSRTPYYYSHGYMDPLWENRLLRPGSETPVATNAEGAVHGPPIAQGVFIATNDHHTNFYNLSPSLILEPGRRYALTLDFIGRPEPAILQFRGGGVFREYVLPDSGNGMSPLHLTRAFGALPTSEHTISLWTDSARAVSVTGLCIAPGRAQVATFPFARFSLHAYRPDDLPIRVTSLMPYRVIAYTPEPAWLETPRMWLGRYRATVNGQAAEVRRSANNLAMVRLDLGDNNVALDYAPGFWLSTSYWAMLAGWATLALLALLKILTAARDAAHLPTGASASGAG